MRSSVGAMAARKIGWFLRTRPACVKFPGGIASFTFDDFPKSALTIGGAILERHGTRGTYYTAMQMAGTTNHFGPMFDAGDLRTAHRAGHEIACHTYSHLDCRHATGATIAAEISENTRAIAAVLDGLTPCDFAYPFGAVSLTAKHILAKRFLSCRGTGAGINQGAIDLADLSVFALYSRSFDAVALRARIDEARSRDGWIIFYTHDVADQPSAFGCTPEELATVVGYACTQRLSVLPVCAALQRIADAPRNGMFLETGTA